MDKTFEQKTIDKLLFKIARLEYENTAIQVELETKLEKVSELEKQLEELTEPVKEETENV